MISKEEKDEEERRINNLFNPVIVDDVCEYIEDGIRELQGFPLNLTDQDQSQQWKKSFSALKTKWKEEREKDGYKAKSLRTAISKDTLKLLKGVDSYKDYEAQIKTILKRAVDQVWLLCDLTSFLAHMKMGLTSKENDAIGVEEEKWAAELENVLSKYDYSNWLNWAGQYAGNVSFSTHVAKLTHSSIKGGSSIYFDRRDEHPEYLTTSALRNKPIDVSQTDNKYAPIGKFLKLKSGLETVANKLIKSDISDFRVFAKDEEQLKKWQQGFLNAFGDEQPASHSLAKQVYFPIADGYHLISPLASSSLDQIVFEKIDEVKFGETSKGIRRQKRENKYASGPAIYYPDLAVIKVTASNHGNASPLNGERGGRRYLFSTKTPQWKTRLSPPVNQKDMFYGEFDSRAWRSARSLQKYLLAFQDRKSNKRIRDNVKKSVNHIIDTLFNYAVEIQNMVDEAGWSERAVTLKKAHGLWLDPYRKDEQFQQTRRRGDWQAEVCYDFGIWLNQKLRHKKMTFEKLEAKSWANILKKRLREFERDLEVVS